jgi:hypothetical protein
VVTRLWCGGAHHGATYSPSPTPPW